MWSRQGPFKEQCLHCGRPIFWVETSYTEGYAWMHEDRGAVWVRVCEGGQMAEPEPEDPQVAI